MNISQIIRKQNIRNNAPFKFSENIVLNSTLCKIYTQFSKREYENIINGGIGEFDKVISGGM